MSKIIVSIVSDQTIPNILFIKNNSADKYIFLLTEKMKKKGVVDNIVLATNLKTSDKIIIDDSSIDKIKRQLENYNFDFVNDDIEVNITGGNKLISLAVYLFFAREGCKIYYLDVNKTDFMMLYPEERTIKTDKYITLKEYVSSYGITITNSSKPYQSLEKIKEFIQKFYIPHRDVIAALNQFQNENTVKQKFQKQSKVSLDDKKIDNTKIMEVLNKYKLLDKLDIVKDMLIFFGERDDAITRKTLRFITGCWFEDYIYHKLLMVGNGVLNLDDIMLSVKLKNNKAETDNEIDIVFVYQNKLTIIECKTSVANPDGSLLQNTIYKQAALNKDFGLVPRSCILIFDKVEESKMSSALKRTDQFSINLIENISSFTDEQLDAEITKILGVR